MSHITRDYGWESKALELMECTNMRKKYEELEMSLKNELIHLSSNISSRFGMFVFTKIERKGSIDYTSIPLLEHFDLEPFRRESTVAWQLRLELEANTPGLIS